MRFEKDVPSILDSIYANCKNLNILYYEIDDLFNDWIMDYIKLLPSHAWISSITNSIEADIICAAIKEDNRFHEFVKKG